MSSAGPLCVNTEGGAGGQPRRASHIWALLLLPPPWAPLSSHLCLPRMSQRCRRQGPCHTSSLARGGTGEPHTVSIGRPPPGLWDRQAWMEDSANSRGWGATWRGWQSQSGVPRPSEASPENLQKMQICGPHVCPPTESETRGGGVVTSPPEGSELVGREKERWERPASLSLQDGETEASRAKGVY